MYCEPSCQIPEAPDHVCLVPFCFPSINTRPGVIVLITFIVILALANSYGYMWRVRHCQEGFT